MDTDPWHRLGEDMTESSSRAQKEVLWPNIAIDVLLLKFKDMCFNVSQGRFRFFSSSSKTCASISARTDLGKPIGAKSTIMLMLPAALITADSSANTSGIFSRIPTTSPSCTWRLPGLCSISTLSALCTGFLRILLSLLVDYYPFTGILRNANKGKLIVDCTTQGVLLVEAGADISLAAFGDLSPLIPRGLEFINNAQVLDPLIGSLIFLLQVRIVVTFQFVRRKLVINELTFLYLNLCLTGNSSKMRRLHIRFEFQPLCY